MGWGHSGINDEAILSPLNTESFYLWLCNKEAIVLQNRSSKKGQGKQAQGARQVFLLKLLYPFHDDWLLAGPNKAVRGFKGTTGTGIYLKAQ